MEVKKAKREEEVEHLKKSESRDGSLMRPCEIAGPMVLYCFAQLLISACQDGQGNRHTQQGMSIHCRNHRRRKGSGGTALGAQGS